VTEAALAFLKANIGRRVEVTCVDGEIVVGEVVMVSADDVLLDAIRQSDGTESSASVLSLQFGEIALVRIAQ
jgi:hypothetical protein